MWPFKKKKVEEKIEVVKKPVDKKIIQQITLINNRTDKQYVYNSNDEELGLILDFGLNFICINQCLDNYTKKEESLARFGIKDFSISTIIFETITIME